jgi:hypothetical protein
MRPYEGYQLVMSVSKIPGSLARRGEWLAGGHF